MRRASNSITVVAIVLLAFVFVVVSQRAYAHCDTLDGPVVIDAKAALDKGNVTPVLKWVRPADEPQIRQAFADTLKVRGLNADARKLADLYFFETVVRVHRAGEGEPYTGLKPAGTKVDPGIAAADRSLTTGKVEPVVDMVNKDIARGITTRFERAMELKPHANEGVDQGRKYVEAYVEYIHYVERLTGDASGETSEHTSEPPEVHRH